MGVFRAAIVGVLVLFAAACLCRADGIASQAPIHYDTARVDDPIARLQKQIDSGKAGLAHDDKHGYLESVLKALGVPVSSQMLVFSKTSFQRDLIAPWKPRALYFNSDVYIGWVQGGEVLEVASIDKELGPVFYTLDQQKAAKPQFVRQADSCLQCHESNATQNMPGLLMRSVYPDASGMPLFSAGTFRTTDASDWRERWGGWYVTGSHGSQRHMGNAIVRKTDDPEHLDLEAGANLPKLTGKLDTSAYLAEGSDVVALMVLAHQTEIHNLITRANYETRIAQRDQAAMNQALGEKPDHVFESTGRRVKSACEPLVRGMLFCEAKPLGDRVVGPSAFAKEFSAAGPRDAFGRTLRDLDLEHRLFKYPCSFLIYSDQFASLPKPAKEFIYKRMGEILSGKESDKDFAHLTQKDREAIREILAGTLKDWPKKAG
jgi:hypothetical protein